MKRLIIGALMLSVALGAGACTSEEPKKKPETLSERAKAVGKMSDQIFSGNMEKNLVDAVDSATKHAAELEKAVE